MESPKISIIIPVYNVEAYITECLQSVMRQTYKGPIECILVDDCGTDKSVELAEKLIEAYVGTIEFVCLHHKKNQGLSCARNTGVDASTGDYLFFLDSDDYISDDCIEVLMHPLKEKEYDMVIGDVDAFGKPQDICYLPQPEGAVIGNEEIFNTFYLKRMIYVMAWNKLLRTNLFKKYDLLFLEGQLHEDELWTYKLTLCLNSLYVCRNVTYHYRFREGSIMSSQNNMVCKSKGRCDTLDFVLDHPFRANKTYYDEYVADRFWRCFGNVGVDNLKLRESYFEFRSRFTYHPIKLYFENRLSFSALKHRIHFSLSPFWGYSYLQLLGWIKRIKTV